MILEEEISNVRRLRSRYLMFCNETSTTHFLRHSSCGSRLLVSQLFVHMYLHERAQVNVKTMSKPFTLGFRTSFRPTSPPLPLLFDETLTFVVRKFATGYGKHLEKKIRTYSCTANNPAVSSNRALIRLLTCGFYVRFRYTQRVQSLTRL